MQKTYLNTRDHGHENMQKTYLNTRDHGHENMQKTYLNTRTYLIMDTRTCRRHT